MLPMAKRPSRAPILYFLGLVVLGAIFAASKTSTPSLETYESDVTVEETNIVAPAAPALSEAAAVAEPFVLSSAAPPPPLVQQVKAPATSTHTKTPDEIATEIAQKVFEKTNAERVKNKLRPLALDTKLATISRAHSADMLAKNYFNHTNQEGCNSACRAKNAKYGYSIIGENIFLMGGFELTPDDESSVIVQGWMGSAGHRANILQSKYTHTGVGVAINGGKVYITVMYSKPR